MLVKNGQSVEFGRVRSVLYVPLMKDDRALGFRPTALLWSHRNGLCWASKRGCGAMIQVAHGFKAEPSASRSAPRW